MIKSEFVSNNGNNLTDSYEERIEWLNSIYTYETFKNHKAPKTTKETDDDYGVRFESIKEIAFDFFARELENAIYDLEKPLLFYITIYINKHLYDNIENDSFANQEYIKMLDWVDKCKSKVVGVGVKSRLGLLNEHKHCEHRSQDERY